MNFKNKFLLVSLLTVTGITLWHCRNKAEPDNTPKNGNPPPNGTTPPDNTPPPPPRSYH